MMTMTMADAPVDDGVVSPRAERPKRRTFTAEYKLAMVAEYDAAEPGAKGALLRREGLYSSHVVEWRRARDAGALDGVTAKPPARGRSPEQTENERLQRDNDRLRRELAKTQAALDVWGKGTRALGAGLRERGHRDAVEAVIAPAVAELAGHTSTKQACELVGWSRATHYRARRPAEPAPVGPRPAPPNALSPAECARVLAELNSRRFVDKSVGQCWATLLDEGTYLCSMSTMHRLLRRAGQAGERRHQATHPARVKPELLATAPQQVWSWDITKLRGPTRGVYYDMYVILDIFSRYVVGWTVAATESAEIAEQLIADAITLHGRPHSLNADRGTSMTSRPVAQLLVDLGVARSHSRPHVSNDNPYSEAAFKTLKYAPVFPDRFGTLADARVFGQAFFGYYNHEHRHSGIGLHTPASVHHGTARRVRAHRAITLAAAYDANPTRFRHRRPQPPRLPEAAWINEPNREALRQTN